MLPRSLHDTLIRVADILRPAHDPWWIIGSAAVALHGAVDRVADVDVLVSVPDAYRILPTLGIAPAPGSASALFRSAVFATWTGPAHPVDVMAGFALRTSTGWRDVGLATRVRVSLGDTALFLPDRTELHDLLLSFGRPKDIARAARLAALD